MIGLIIVIVFIAIGIAIAYSHSGSKRMCPFCHALMSKKATQCPHCRKAVPLGY